MVYGKGASRDWVRLFQQWGVGLVVALRLLSIVITRLEIFEI